MRTKTRLLLAGVVLAATASGCGSLRSHSESSAWVEVRSPHFTVVSDAGTRKARHTAGQFERMRAVFQTALPEARVDSGRPLIILAVRDEAGLTTLLPAFWEKEGQKHPAGIFVPGREKNYVALRLDAEGENPYQLIYHEYVHQLVSLNFDRIPLWLNEGLAEFYGNTTVGEKGASLGRPIARHVHYLQSNRRISLETLLTADRFSPLYNEANKTSLFYAQSWALTHYLILGGKGARKQRLIEYLALLDQDISPLEAARRAFGDLKQFSEELEAYIQRTRFYYLPIPLSLEADETSYLVRRISQAESAAIRGEFLLRTNRHREARSLLEEALRSDPELALVHENLGLLQLQEGNPGGALESFDRAIGLNSGSFLAHYYRALLLLQDTQRPFRVVLAESDFRRAIEINPGFSPAYSALAAIYAAQGTRLEAALPIARKAADLEPGVIENQLLVARILLRLGKGAEARQVGKRALAAAQSPRDRAMVEAFLQSVPRDRKDSTPDGR